MKQLGGKDRRGLLEGQQVPLGQITDRIEDADLTEESAIRAGGGRPTVAMALSNSVE
jgi:hypothetical protein